MNNNINDILGKLQQALKEPVVINISDKKSICDFLELYKGASIAEYSILAGVSRNKIIQWQHLCKGDTNKRKRHYNRYYPRNSKLYWDNYDWLYRMRYYGIANIAKLVGVGIATICRRTRKYGIDTVYSSIHPCNNKKWLEYHINHGFTIGTCALIAGVSRQTISCWLVKYGL